MTTNDLSGLAKQAPTEDTRRKRLTKAATADDVTNAAPEDKKYRLSVGDPKGLNLIVMPTGAKYWVLRSRDKVTGVAKDISVGKPWPATSLKEARSKAKALLVLIDGGADLTEQRKQEKLRRQSIAAHTFDEAAEAWFQYRSVHWKPATSAQVRMYLDKDLISVLGRRPLAAITTFELANLLEKILDRKAPDIVKKCRQWLDAIFSYSRGKGWTTVDPVRDLEEVTRYLTSSTNYPHLSISELPQFLRDLDGFDASSIVKGAINLVLWTGNRPGVTQTLRWSELDLDKAEWQIPENRKGMKRGYKHTVPLPHQAIAMLRDLYNLSGSFDWVFVGRNAPDKPISDGAANQLLLRMGYRGRQTMHGFRHLISTALNERGYNSDWIERQLAHGNPKGIRGTYNKAIHLEGRRTMMQDWANELDEMRKG